MRIAFYAPMRPPGEDGTSGDRAIAALLWEGLEALGHDVFLGSRIKTWRTAPQDLFPLLDRSSTDAAKLHNREIDLFFTYHSYYKAPDLIGPRLAARNIPYVIAEASLSAKRKEGPWAEGYKAALQSVEAADVLLSITERDRPGLAEAGFENKVIDLPLYSRLAPAQAADGKPQELVSVAMMRQGDKLASYKALANALEQVSTAWTLTIVGDGPMRTNVEKLFNGFGERVTYAGELQGEALQAALCKAGTFIWPGVGEGLGMAYLDAIACGLPCIGLDEPGPRAAIGTHGVLVSEADFPAAIDRMIGEGGEWAAFKAGLMANKNSGDAKAKFLDALQKAILRATS